MNIRSPSLLVCVSILLIFLPLQAAHADSTLDFSADDSNHWQYMSNFGDGHIFSMFAASNGQGSVGIQPDPTDTNVSNTVGIEAMMADTHGNTFVNPCSTAHYTGDPITDFACVVHAAISQGYSYALGEAAAMAPPPVVVEPPPVVTEPPPPVRLRPCGC